eukprot:1183831-Prorocentrum_minimum.AAC.3
MLQKRLKYTHVLMQYQYLYLYPHQLRQACRQVCCVSEACTVVVSLAHGEITPNLDTFKLRLVPFRTASASTEMQSLTRLSDGRRVIINYGSPDAGRYIKHSDVNGRAARLVVRAIRWEDGDEPIGKQIRRQGNTWRVRNPMTKFFKKIQTKKQVKLAPPEPLPPPIPVEIRKEPQTLMDILVDKLRTTDAEQVKKVRAGSLEIARRFHLSNPREAV